MIKIKKVLLNEAVGVYDLTVPSTSSFLANGVVVHNCQEIALPTKPYKSVDHLYQAYNEDHGEIALCSLAGVIVSNIESDEEYAKVAYYALKMISVCIHKSDYIFKSLEHTGKARMSAGVGILGLAHLMAKKNLKITEQSGKDFVHELAETHFWHLANASLELSKEFGLAPWMNKTKWPDGWLPIDTYEKAVDELVTVGNKRDWEKLRQEIILNGGIAHSTLVAHMPGESSTVASGTTNSIYMIREFDLVKTNDTAVTRWVAPESTKLAKKYQIVWGVSEEDQIKEYAIFQKFCDQTISSDIFLSLEGNVQINTSQIIKMVLLMTKFGMKTRYYINSKTGKAIFQNEEFKAPLEETDEYCESCSL